MGSVAHKHTLSTLYYQLLFNSHVTELLSSYTLTEEVMKCCWHQIKKSNPQINSLNSSVSAFDMLKLILNF